jgi:hypothetical protein
VIHFARVFPASTLLPIGVNQVDRSALLLSGSVCRFKANRIILICLLVAGRGLFWPPG